MSTQLPYVGFNKVNLILSYLILSYANTVLKFYIHVIIFIYLYLIVYNVQLIICLVISLL